jgi:hypothetical protein
VWGLDFFVGIFAIMGLSGLFHYVLLRAYAPIAEAEMYRLKEKMIAKKNH